MILSMFLTYRRLKRKQDIGSIRARDWLRLPVWIVRVGEQNLLQQILRAQSKDARCRE